MLLPGAWLHLTNTSITRCTVSRLFFSPYVCRSGVSHVTANRWPVTVEWGKYTTNLDKVAVSGPRGLESKDPSIGWLNTVKNVEANCEQWRLFLLSVEPEELNACVCFHSCVVYPWRCTPYPFSHSFHYNLQQDEKGSNQWDLLCCLTLTDENDIH